MRPTGSGRRVEAHRRRRSLARGFRGGVSPSLVSGGYHFWCCVPELGVVRHLSILTLCALLFFRFASLPFYTVGTEQKLQRDSPFRLHDGIPSKACRPCACLPRGHDPGRDWVATADDWEAPGCDASSEPEIRAQTIINAPTRGVGDGASDGWGERRSSPAAGQWFAGPLQRHIRGRDGNLVRACVCVCLPRREKKKEERGSAPTTQAARVERTSRWLPRLQEGVLASSFSLPPSPPPPPRSLSASGSSLSRVVLVSDCVCMKATRGVGDYTFVLSLLCAIACPPSGASQAGRGPCSSAPQRGRSVGFLASHARRECPGPRMAAAGGWSAHSFVGCPPVARCGLGGWTGAPGWSRKAAGHRDCRPPQAPGWMEQGIGSSEPRRRGSQTRPSAHTRCRARAGHGLGGHRWIFPGRDR